MTWKGRIMTFRQKGRQGDRVDEVTILVFTIPRLSASRVPGRTKECLASRTAMAEVT
jgi:hypothetical protein